MKKHSKPEYKTFIPTENVNKILNNQYINYLYIAITYRIFYKKFGIDKVYTNLNLIIWTT